MLSKPGFILLIIVLLLTMSACSKDDSLIPPKSIYDFPDNKLWAHRINTAKDAIDVLQNFRGIETDVYFLNDINKFQTGHDNPSGINLDSFFDSIPFCSHYYYWIDFKNLSKNNVKNAVNEMLHIIEKYRLQHRVIVESSNAELLADFKNNNIFTSYWISDISNNNFPVISQQILKKEIQFKMNKYHFNVISAYYKMYPFLHKYFANYNIHLWTNGLITESDKSQIEDLTYNQDVKVILVDYKDNFLFSNKPGF
jgi:hypothetical protein